MSLLVVAVLLRLFVVAVVIVVLAGVGGVVCQRKLSLCVACSVLVVVVVVVILVAGCRGWYAVFTSQVDWPQKEGAVTHTAGTMFSSKYGAVEWCAKTNKLFFGTKTCSRGRCPAVFSEFDVTAHPSTRRLSQQQVPWLRSENQSTPCVCYQPSSSWHASSLSSLHRRRRRRPRKARPVSNQRAAAMLD